MISKIKQHRKNIKTIFQQSLDLNSSAQLVCDYVSKLYPNTKNIHIVALGKSASAMLEGAIKALDKNFCDAFLVTKDQVDSKILVNQTTIQVILSGHPIPDENSLSAGKKLIDYLQLLKKEDEILFLLSGGSSSLVEYFPESMADKISIDDLIRLNKWLLASDRNIMDVNQIRKKVSGIKAGRLLKYCNSTNINALYISDVPDDKLTNIGSGLLVPENMVEKINNIPAWISDLIEQSKTYSEPLIEKQINIESQIIFSNLMLRESLHCLASNFNYNSNNMDEFLVGNTIIEATKLATWLKKQKPGLYIWGAETHMSLPDNPGRGGRNQSFALVVARELHKCPNIVVLIAATDGNDGNTMDAGAIIDGETISRGEFNNASVISCLENANAGQFLSASGDLLTLAATGTNVMDIIMAIIWD